LADSCSLLLIWYVAETIQVAKKLLGGGSTPLNLSEKTALIFVMMLEHTARRQFGTLLPCFAHDRCITASGSGTKF
jgi:hypothetical protein